MRLKGKSVPSRIYMDHSTPPSRNHDFPSQPYIFLLPSSASPMDQTDKSVIQASQASYIDISSTTSKRIPLLLNRLML
jgi:hypothetical protein